VHRNGRPGRAGREGVAITLAEPREHRSLRNIEHATKQRIDVATIPTVADLRARRLELTRASLHESLLGDDLDGVRVIVESLADDFDVMDIAAAAVKLALDATGPEGEAQDIPAVTMPRERPGRGSRERRGTPGRGSERGTSRGRGRRTREAPPWDVTRIYVGAGRAAGVRPGDLVGAIANEVGIEAHVIGAIDIADRFSLVEVPEEIVDDIIDALRGTTIKGKRVVVRRDRM
jgi:ATP-dependent RNA helicase DeaD